MDQDAWAVCSILELVCSRVNTEVPTVKTIFIQSDNAGTYAKKLFPVVAPFIYMK